MVETAVECVWPFGPQEALHEKLSCYHDSHIGLGSILENPHCINATWNSFIHGGIYTSILSRNSDEFSGPKFMSDGLKDGGNVLCG